MVIFHSYVKLPEGMLEEASPPVMNCGTWKSARNGVSIGKTHKQIVYFPAKAMLDKTGGFCIISQPYGLIRLMGGIHYGKKMWMVD